MMPASESNATVYLFAGDSLTEGAYGASYVDRLAAVLGAARPDAGGRLRVVNAGRSGETVTTLQRRLGDLLARYEPDRVVLAVGCNDVWLPWLAERSIGWRLWLGYRRLAAGLRTTVDLDRFAAAYRDLIDQARQAGAEVVVCTAGPVGERLSSPVNGRMARMNGVIKHVAAAQQVPVADVWQAFVEALAVEGHHSSYLSGEWLFAWLDRRRYHAQRVDELAARRRLHLTFDGVHLNSRGAQLWADTLLTTLRRAERETAGRRQALARYLDLPGFELGALTVCHSPGLGARARDVAWMLAAAYDYLAELTGGRPALNAALLTGVHWRQSRCPAAYPAPHGRWNGVSGMLYVPDAYDQAFLRDWHLPETVAAWTAWPPGLSDVGAPAQMTALADRLAVEEMARLFLHELRVAPADPALARLLAAYLTQVVFHGTAAGGSRRMAAVWNAWGEILARAGVGAGHRRLRAHELYLRHGEDLAATLAAPLPSLEEQVAETTVESLA
jgi:lysophospholipase L1-like esterase